MLRLLELWCIIAIVIGLIVAACFFGPRNNEVAWIGGTNLEMLFLVADSESGNPIQDAQIRVRSDGGFYDGGRDGDEQFDLHTDVEGKAIRQLANNRCIGRGNTSYHVYTPHWQISVVAPGYEPSASIDVYAEYQGKAERLGLGSDRLTIKIPLQRRPR